MLVLEKMIFIFNEDSLSGSWGGCGGGGTIRITRVSPEQRSNAATRDGIIAGVVLGIIGFIVLVILLKISKKKGVSIFSRKRSNQTNAGVDPVHTLRRQRQQVGKSSLSESFTFHLKRAREQMEKGQRSFDDADFTKARTHWEGSVESYQKALKIRPQDGTLSENVDPEIKLRESINTIHQNILNTYVNEAAALDKQAGIMEIAGSTRLGASGT